VLLLEHTEEVVAWTLFNALGQLVAYRNFTPAPQQQIVVSDLPAGYYLLRLEAAGISRTLPLLKE